MPPVFWSTSSISDISFPLPLASRPLRSPIVTADNGLDGRNVHTYSTPDVALSTTTIMTTIGLEHYEHANNAVTTPSTSDSGFSSGHNSKSSNDHYYDHIALVHFHFQLD